MRRLQWIPLIVALLTLVPGVLWVQAQPHKVKKVFVADLPGQNITQDQGPLPSDPTCQAGLLCTSWQTIAGSTIGPIEVDDAATLLITLIATYDCDGCVDAFGFPFTQLRVELSTDGGPFAVVALNGFGWPVYIHNSGSAVVLRRPIAIGEGSHTVRVQHRFSVDTGNNGFLAGPGGRLGLDAGVVTVEVLRSHED